MVRPVRNDRLVHELLAAWGGITVVKPLGGGNRNTVLEIRRGHQRLVARQSRRPPDSLDWEIALLDYLAGQGMRVPRFIAALDGRRHIPRLRILVGSIRA